MTDIYISRESLGRVAQIGDLYDARSDAFLSSCLRCSPPEKSITLMDAPHSEIRYFSSSNLTEKLDKLNIDSELKHSVLFGLVSLTGSGEYLKEEKRSSKSASASLIYSIRTKMERFNLFLDGAEKCISIKAIMDTNATHLVSKIDWGANCIIEVQSQTDTLEDVKDLEGKLQVSLMEGFGSVAERSDELKNATGRFTLTVFGDVLPDTEELPQRLHEALALMKKLPSLVMKANDGKGKPLLYQLYSLNEIQKFLQFQNFVDRSVCYLSATSMKENAILLEKLSVQKQILNDLYEEAEKNKKYISPADTANIQQHKEGFQLQEVGFREKLAGTLKDVRFGRKDCTELDRLRIEFIENTYGLKAMERFIDSSSKLFKKVKLIQTFVQEGITHLSPQEVCSLIENKETACVFYFGRTSYFNPKERSHVVALAKKLLEMGVEYAVMEDEGADCSHDRIEYYKNGELTQPITDVSRVEAVREITTRKDVTEQISGSLQGKITELEAKMCKFQEELELLKKLQTEQDLSAARAAKPDLTKLVHEVLIPQLENRSMSRNTELAILSLNKLTKMNKKLQENREKLIPALTIAAMVCDLIGPILQITDKVLCVDVWSWPVSVLCCLVARSMGSTIVQLDSGNRVSKVKPLMEKMCPVAESPYIQYVIEAESKIHKDLAPYRIIIVWVVKDLVPAGYMQFLQYGGYLISAENEKTYTAFRKSRTGEAVKLNWRATTGV